MKRLGILLFVFALALLLPLGYLVRGAYQSLEQEERAKMRFFAEALFMGMEEELAELVAKEEARPLDHYGHFLTPDENGATSRSPLAFPPKEPYILGYFQNNPDGSFQTPLLPSDLDPYNLPSEVELYVLKLRGMNNRFNNLRSQVVDNLPPSLGSETQTAGAEESLAEPYLDMPKNNKLSLAQKSPVKEMGPKEKAQAMAWLNQGKTLPPQGMELEMAPLQAVALDRENIFLFRRVVLGNQVYRQGFILLAPEFMRHLAKRYFSGQPMARYAGLWLKSSLPGKGEIMIQAGAVAEGTDFQLVRQFPRPFDFLKGTLACDHIPESPGRGALGTLTGGLILVMILGLAAIYRSASVIMEHSRRRSGFVSSVTHELKTPLANIQLYLDMLDQGMGRDEKQRNHYLGIIRMESGRLGRLIASVLEFSQLEDGRRALDIKAQDVLVLVTEAAQNMAAKLKQKGFSLVIEAPDELPLAMFDREALLQILLNLLENSIKFAGEAKRKDIRVTVTAQDPWVGIEVRDYGPGIPASARKKIFQDFYRVDDSLTRKTKGTGIGLALVHKLTKAMRGEVKASQPEEGPGLRIVVKLPQAPEP